MPSKLENQTVWITGASSGVGEGLARVCCREGANIILSARRENELERVKDSCAGGTGNIQVVPFDVTDAAQRAAAVEQVLADNPRLDVLVNNAGIGQRALVKDTDLDVDRRVMEVDYFAPVALTKLVIPHMMEQRVGHLIVTSSVAGKHGMPYHSAYCAAKHALHGYFDTLRVELLEYNVQVMLLVIAGVRSNVAQHSLLGDGSEYGDDPWGSDVGMSAEECGEQVVDAMLAGEYEPVIAIEEATHAMRLKDQNPKEFVQRMAALMEWLGK
jgi:short-subunit dehydrogenase